MNVDKNDLECQDIVNIKKCKVPKSHFEGKTGGYYPIRHINNNNVYAIDFETFGDMVKMNINIDFNSEDRNYSIGKENGIIPMESFSSVDNIFDRSDIEEKTQFEIELTCDSNNKYALKCRLWLGDEDIISVFCNFKEGLISNEIISQAQIQ